MTREEFEHKFNAASQARDRDAPDEGIGLIEELLLSGQDRPVVLGTMFSYEKDDAVRPEPVLRESVALSPRSEMASIALFHPLVRLGRLAEAERFLVLEAQDSEEYRRLLTEIAGGSP